MGLLEPAKYGEQFHKLYMNNFDKKSSTDRHKNRKGKGDKRKSIKYHDFSSAPINAIDQIELEPNASKFAVFSAVRSSVLESQTKYSHLYGIHGTTGFSKVSLINACCYHCTSACKTGAIVECRCHHTKTKSSDNDSDVDSYSEDTTEKDVVLQVPQIVGAGLRGLFDLIAEARSVSPTLCAKALKALFDVIQGQIPESFKNEPSDLIDPLYDLLLDLTTLHGPTSSQGNDATNWSSIGCSALLGLCVARGETGKTLKAIAALLMSPKILASQNIQLPLVLTTLQRSVYCVALGKPTKPDYYRNGIPRNSLIIQFSLKNQLPANIQYNLQPCTASNGKYIFILTGKTLLKIGSGFNGTLRGYVYSVNNEFGKDKNGWIGFCGDILFYKKLSKRVNESMLIVNTETLNITCAAQVNIPSTKDGQHCLLFSDGESLNAICIGSDDTLVVKQIYTIGNSISDLPLKLARKRFKTLGYAAFEDEVLNQNQIQLIQTTFNPFEPKLPNEQEVAGIVCGKEFGLVRATNGKIFYYGKSSAIGLKSVGKTASLKMSELIISKVSNIVQVTIGHDGIHAILVNDDGTVYFCGTARRGEDGDTSKNRRQPKAVKPKKLSKIDSHFIVNASCNNGTSAFVTKTGKLIMFGKDTTNCDSSGLVTDLLDQHITRVSLGKAHCAAINSKGQLFTFGLNNKGQCGRPKGKDFGSVPVESNEQKGFKLDSSSVCDLDEHNIVQGHCRVCSICRECTGYNTSCVSTQNISLENRVPGSNCACGHGDAGCSKCGACSTCISVQEADGSCGGFSADSKENATFNFLVRQRSKTLITRQNDKKSDEVTHNFDTERDTPRVAPLPPCRICLPSTSPVVQISCGMHHTVVLTLTGEVFTFGSNQYGQLGTGDLQPHFGPIQVKVSGSVCQVAAGSNHTVLLTSKGIIYTFGNHQKGQLGRLPNDIHRNHADDMSKSEHTSDDSVPNVSNVFLQRQKYLWNCTPGAVCGIGPNFGKKATWINASGDQTFFKIDESLITGSMLSKVNVIADKNTIILIPQISLSFNCLTINRRDGSCNAHSLNQVDFAKIIQTNNNAITQLASDKCNQNIEVNNFIPNHQDRMSQSVHEARNQIFDEHLKFTEHRKKKRSEQKSVERIMPQLAFALDICYNVLWVFDAISKKIMCYNVIASEMNNGNENSNLSCSRAILSPELALPQKPEIQITRNQASLNILTCLDILTSGQDVIPTCFDQIRPRSVSPMKESQNNEFQIASRFENFGGGWGYSGHSVEAIRFMADTDIFLCGFSMFGGRGEYTCKLKLYDLGMDGGGYEKDGTLVSETDEIPYECPARSKHNIMLSKPITANAGKWFLVWARISGPSSDCGSSGQATVTTEDQIVFNFKTSKKANNGTDVNSGQIPSILYRVISQETKQPVICVDLDPVYKISKMFANTVTRDCFENLVMLLNWAWGTFKLTLTKLKDKKKLPQTTASLNRLFYINKACLRLLRKYTNEIYPNNVFIKVDKSHSSKEEILLKNDMNAYVDNQGASTSKSVGVGSKFYMGNSMDAATPTNPKKVNSENLQLAECIGNVRALLIQILCDEIPGDIEVEGFETTFEILDECHTTFLSCFNAFYPTSTLKWNCLCDLLALEDKGTYHPRLLSAIVAGLCNPGVKLLNTFSLLSSNRESKSIISPSDNSGLPMLSSTENHQYPILVEQMIYRTQQEKNDFQTNSWNFKDVLVRLLEITSYPIKSKIENIYNRSNQSNCFNRQIYQKLVENCCHLLARVLAEVVYQSCSSDIEQNFLPSRSILSTGSRFTRCDVSRTWNTGNFGPDAIAFSVNRSGIAIAGAMVYSGSGSYEYQLELLYDSIESQSQHKWETLESISGTYDQDIVQNDMAEIKFDRPVPIKENVRYAVRLCSQGARTCSGDAGMISIRGPCGTNFSFYPCDLSFNGTTPARGQIPCLLYTSTPLKNETHIGKVLNEIHARDTALQIATDITKKCIDILILTRNTLATSISPSEKSLNSSNNTQTIDSEQNITPIEEHFDVAFANNSNNTITNTPTTGYSEGNVSTARDITKRIESFSKGIMETLKFDKRSTNPFEFEIEIGATEIHPKDLANDQDIQDRNLKNGRMSKMNGNNSNFRNFLNEIAKSGSEDDYSEMSVAQILKLFEDKSASMFHTLLPLVLAHIGPLASSDPKSSVQILSLIREILPHVSALNQIYCSRDKIDSKDIGIGSSLSGSHIREINKSNFFSKDLEEAKQHILDLNTTSNHYCIVESDHPYKSASISTFRVKFPPSVQWFTIEFDHQCGTVQPEDYLLITIPTKSQNSNWLYDQSRQQGNQSILADCGKGHFENLNNDKFSVCRNACITSYIMTRDDESLKNTKPVKSSDGENDRIIVKIFNSSSQWTQTALVLPGNQIDFSLETSSEYARDSQAIKYGFRCLIVGYENPSMIKLPNACLNRLECELAYLGGMCSSHLMKKDLTLPGDSQAEDYTIVEETIATHASLLSKGLALSDSVLTINQALESYLPVGGQSNERQFLKDFVSAAPGSSGARLAAWLQPEPRLDPNKCELKAIQEPVRYGWPTQLTVITRDQYGDTVYIPDLKIEIKATPSGSLIGGGRKIKRASTFEHSYKGLLLPPKIPYEPTIKDKMCFKAMTFMKAYQQYSFEELRLCSPSQTKVTETLIAQDMGDLTFGAFWTPNSIGHFCITVSLDGIALEEVYRIEVKEANMPPPSQKSTIKKTQPQNKLRKFIAKNSAGLRIRSHPTLQSEQVGIIKMNGIISFIDENENDDGIWVRLSTESIRQHCTTGWYPPEAWCLQYNQHLGKKLLYPVVESQSTLTQEHKNSGKSSDEIYESVNEAIESHSAAITSSPSKKGFDFSLAKLTPPSGGLPPPSNPFIFTSNNVVFDQSEHQEMTKLDPTNPFDIKPLECAEKSDLNSDKASVDYSQSSSFREDEDKRCPMQSQLSQCLRSSSSSQSSQSNIGTTIAGVVGGGASKLQALQKWFKGDSFEGKESPKKRSEISELASVSVRDLVKVIGGQDSKSNGNGSTPPHHSQCSSPVAVPSGRQDLNSAYSCSSRSIEISDSSIAITSLTKDLSQSQSQNSFREESFESTHFDGFLESHRSHTDEATVVPRITYSTTPNSPKYSPRKTKSKVTASPSKAYYSHTPPPSYTRAREITQSDEKFQQKDGIVSDLTHALNSHNDEKIGRNQNDSAANLEADIGRQVLSKRALPSSIAESLRAVFAAFLWHEGIVHDAMACSSFLKFHPSLPKESALVTNEEEVNVTRMSLSREQRAQQRYSVEVANAGNYLNIRPSTLETLTKSGNSSLHNRRYRKNGGNGAGGDALSSTRNDQAKLHPLPEFTGTCPPALKCLVYLWEQLCSSCVEIAQSNVAELSKDSPDIHLSKQLSGERNRPNQNGKKNKKKKKDDGTWCELCEVFLSISVTYHMRIVHPGCGKPAKGKGYNSVGTFCEGWAGNCGEGGKGASSWYLMCDQCREKYTSKKMNINNINTTTNQTFPSSQKIENLLILKPNSIVNSEVYKMLKENSMFLLELSSTGSGGILGNQKKSPQQMPVVTETQLHQIASDLNKPSTSRGDAMLFKNGSKIGFNNSKGPISSTPHNRRSEIPICTSPELLWQAPDTFSCLESLGTSMTNESPYTCFGFNITENGSDRPLSEVSLDSIERSAFNPEIGGNPASSMSRFHRSFSMGQGWPSQGITNKYNVQLSGESGGIQNQSAKVVFRRRNNSTCDDGSLLLCHPSENLRKLVPESVFSILKATKMDEKNKIEDDIEKESIKEDKGNDWKNKLNLEANTCLLSRPTMVFILEQHNLEKLRYSLKRSLRVATCRIYSLQALNWLMRSVTQTSCLHDLMWWFVGSLKPSLADDALKVDESDQALEHPVSSTQMCGKISLLLTQSFHNFLQTVADITLMLPPGSALQQIAIQCFGIKFRQVDHQFLHRSHVFGNISKILSRSDEQNEDMLLLSSAALLESNVHGTGHQFSGYPDTKVINLFDLAGMFEVTVSSRQAMAASLTDGCTETFWESDDEDRNKSKVIEMSLSKLNYIAKSIFVHIDNSRDIQNKVSNVVFYAGQSLGDTNLIKSIDVDSKSNVWLSANIPDESWTHFRLEFRGPENTLRVRQVKLLGLPIIIEEFINKHSTKSTNAIQIQQRSCELETLRVFRLITAQVFGKLILGQQNIDNINKPANGQIETSASSLLAESLDLREHMVGILFSRSKLSHLQKQVIVHIVHAIRKETHRAREEWEILNVTVYQNQPNVEEKSDSSSENSRAPDTYCFEMLSMVLALSGSAVGRSYLSHQHGLLKDLLCLLHTGSDRVQRQVTSLLRRILPEITPEHFAELLGVHPLPPTDFSIAHQSSYIFDMNRLNIIDIFLSVIAKSLQLQVKLKTLSATAPNKQTGTVKLCNSIDLFIHCLKNSATRLEQIDGQVDKSADEIAGLFDFESSKNVAASSNSAGSVGASKNEFRNLNEMVNTLQEQPRKNINYLWFLKGSISVKQAENIISLIKDMTSGKFGESWSLITKAAIAESILNLTRLDEIFRPHDVCIKTPTLWLALASLCVLDKDHVERLSSGQWSKSSETRPLCSNHDDGTTSAVIQCESCGSLCSDCDRFLHLNRKTRSHHRTVCKEEEEAIRVELHESCGRTKLFWLLALADSKSLKAMVEFRDGNNAILSGPSSSIGRCRFCGVTGNSGLLAIGNVCADAQCQEHAANTCAKSKPCGHPCGGVANETKCLPCLQLMCNVKDSENIDNIIEPKLTQDADDMCMICFEALSCAPAIQLECGHVFHYHCCKLVLQKRWTGPRISFGFSQCPICKLDISHTLLNDVLEPIVLLKNDVKRKAMMRLEYEGIIKTSDNKDLSSYAMDRYAYYVCFKCQKAYYGGEARCDAELGDKYDPQELVCGGCSDVARAQMCPKHGTDYLEYKCRYCCSVAVFFCFGTTHFCDTCHDDFQRLTNIPKNKLPRCPAGPKAKQLLGDDCPLHVVHPPTGEEFALGCGICRNAQTF